MGDIELDIDARYINTAFQPYIYCQAPLQIFFGGASSGKSVFVAQRVAIDLLRGGRNYLLVRNVAATIRGSSWTELRKAISDMRLSEYFDANETNLELTCKRNGYMAFCRGLDDPEKIKSITPRIGVLTDIWEEEATETTEAAHNQLLLRMRGPSSLRKRVTMTFNPIDFRHWIRTRYMSGFADTDTISQTDKILIHRSTYKDNAYLTVDDIERIEAYKDTNPYYYSVYGLGHWGTLGDSIFTNWQTDDLSTFDYGELKWGLDFGYSNDPAALVGACLKGDTIFIPVSLFGKGWTNQHLAERIAPIVGKGIVRCDSAEPKSIAELRHAGVQAYPTRKRQYFTRLNPSRQSSILYRIQWMQGKKVLVDKKQAQLISELGLYQWRKDKWGDSLAEPVDRDDHGISALWYALDDVMEPGGAWPTVTTAHTLLQKSNENSVADSILLNGVAA